MGNAVRFTVSRAMDLRILAFAAMWFLTAGTPGYAACNIVNGKAYGDCAGDIAVHEGARLRLTGVVNGTVNNLGGNVEVEGTLNHLHTIGGKVVIGGSVGRVSGRGLASYKKGAIVGGVPVNKATRKAGKQ